MLVKISKIFMINVLDKKKLNYVFYKHFLKFKKKEYTLI